MPDIKFPNVDLEKAAADFNKAVKEAAYLAVGLGILGFQRAQVQRVELMKQLEGQLGSLSNLTDTLNSQAETYLSEARDQFSRISAELPDASELRGQLTDLAKAVDEAVGPVRQQLDDQLDRLEEVLPETARNLVQAARAAAAVQERTVRNAVGLD